MFQTSWSADVCLHSLIGSVSCDAEPFHTFCEEEKTWARETTAKRTTRRTRSRRRTARLRPSRQARSNRRHCKKPGFFKNRASFVSRSAGGKCGATNETPGCCPFFALHDLRGLSGSTIGVLAAQSPRHFETVAFHQGGIAEDVRGRAGGAELSGVEQQDSVAEIDDNVEVMRRDDLAA